MSIEDKPDQAPAGGAVPEDTTRFLTEAALVQRVNQALAHEGQRLFRCRADSRHYLELGRFYLVDVSRNCIEAKGMDLEALARELAVLQPGETLQTDEGEQPSG